MRQAIVAIALLVVGCAAPEAPGGPAPDRDCFNLRLVTGYGVVDRDTISVSAGPSADYEIDLAGARCNDVDWTHRLAIESTPSSWICVGPYSGQGYIYFRDPATRDRVQCDITDVRRIGQPAAPAPGS